MYPVEETTEQRRGSETNKTSVRRNKGECLKVTGVSRLGACTPFLISLCLQKAILFFISE